MNRMKKMIRLLVTVCLMFTLWVLPVWADVETYFDTAEDLRWDEYETGLARWDKVEKAKLYEVRLHRDELIVKRVEVTTNKVNLLEYMEDNHMYTFSVRAIPKSSQKTYGKGEWAFSDAMEATGVGESRGRFRTYREGSKYQLEDGGYVTNQWRLIETCWYYFNADGYMLTGWQQIGGTWYYLGTDGKMQTGWIQLDGIWYYLEESGAMKTGWVEYQPGKWYYLDTNGQMLTNTVVGGYQLDATGLWVQ